MPAVPSYATTTDNVVSELLLTLQSSLIVSYSFRYLISHRFFFFLFSFFYKPSTLAQASTTS